MVRNIKYRNFDLQIEKSGDDYIAEIIASPAGEAEAHFKNPFSEQELLNFFAVVGELKQNTREHQLKAAELAEDFGNRLFKAVFNGAVRGTFRSSLDIARLEGAGLCIRLRLDEVPELAVMPWEYLYYPSLGNFLTLSPKTSIIRYPELAQPVRTLTVTTPPLNVLVMISSPWDYKQLDCEQEWTNLQEAFQQLQQQGLVTLDLLEKATLDELQQKLSQKEYHIFHYVGHGTFDKQSQQGMLILENDSEQGQPVDGQSLGTILYGHHTLRLAFLNACKGGQSSRQSPFSGVAQRLAQQGVPAVIAMQFPVRDEIAITFSESFYDFLTEGMPIDAALAEARKSIYTRGGQGEWGTPVIYTRSSENSIVNFPQNNDKVKLSSVVDTPPEPVVVKPDDRKIVKSRRAVLTGAILFVLILISFYVISNFFIPVPISPTTIAVLPFSVQGSDDFVCLDKGMVRLLSTNLDHAGELRCADPRAVLSLTMQSDVDNMLEKAGNIAERLGAGLFVLGNIIELRGDLDIAASLYEYKNKKVTLLTREVVRGNSNQFFPLFDKLTRALLVRLNVVNTNRIKQEAIGTTTSLPALKAYLKGEDEFLAGRFTSASQLFQNAVQVDSIFALAHYRLSITARWLRKFDLAREAAEAAVRHKERLSEHDQDLLNAYLATRRGETSKAIQLYRNLVNTHKEDVEAWWNLAEIEFHFGPLEGRSIVKSRDEWQQVLAIEPDNIFARLHLACIAGIEKNWVEFDSLTNIKIEHHEYSEVKLTIRALRSFMLEDSIKQKKILSKLNNASDLTLLMTTWNLSVYLQNIEAAEKVALLLKTKPRIEKIQTIGHIVIACLKLSRGQWQEAEAELIAAEALDYPLALEFRALLSVMPFLKISHDKLLELEKKLGQVKLKPATEIKPAGPHFTSLDRIHKPIKDYLLGLLNARLGNYDKALKYAKTLEKNNDSDEAGTLSRSFAQGLRANIASGKDETTKALAELEKIKMTAPYELMLESPFHSQALARFQKAFLMDELGRNGDALRWYHSFAEHSIYNLIYLAPSHFQRARLYRQLEQNEQATVHYNRFIELWQSCDPELKMMLEHAEQWLAQTM